MGHQVQRDPLVRMEAFHAAGEVLHRNGETDARLCLDHHRDLAAVAEAVVAFDARANALHWDVHLVVESVDLARSPELGLEVEAQRFVVDSDALVAGQEIAGNYPDLVAGGSATVAGCF